MDYLEKNISIRTIPLWVKRFIPMQIFICTLLMLIFPYNIFATYKGAVTANSAILMNLDTGEILYGRNMHTALPPASTTKVMTFILTMENCKLTDMVTIGPNPPNAIGSAIGLKNGEIMSVNDLLHGLLMESGNDAALALAEHVGGTEANFVNMMNAKAKELGCNDSHFKNCSGLFEKGHVMSSYDLSLLTGEAMKYPIFSEICQTIMYKLAPTNLIKTDRYVNVENKMVQPLSPRYYKYAIAGKTGYTTESLHSYTAVARKNGMTLICSIINDDNLNYYSEVKDLFNYGFDNYSLKKIISKDAVLFNYPIGNNKYAPILSGEDIYGLSEINSPQTYNVNLPKNITGKIFNGTVVIDHSNIKNIKLYSNTDVAINPINTQKKRNNLLYYAAILVECFIFLIILLVVLIKSLRVYNINRIKKNRKLNRLKK